MTDRYQQASTVLAQEVGVGLDDDRWFTIRGTGVILWRLLNVPRTVEELTDECVDIFSGSPEQIRDDVAQTVSKWVENGILVCR
jgi:hypothetical protein